MEDTYMVVRSDDSDVTHLTHVINLEDDMIIIGSLITECGIPCDNWRLPYGVFRVMPKASWFDKVTCFKCYIKD